MFRERIARLQAAIKDPDLKKSVRNFVDYRKRKKVPDDVIWTQLQKEYPDLTQGSWAVCEGTAALQLDPLPDDEPSDIADCDILNSESEPESRSVAVLNSATAPAEEVLNRFSTPERVTEIVPTPEQIAAVMAEMVNLQVSHLKQIGEGVVIEMPGPKARAESQPSAEPAPSKDSASPAEGGKENSARRLMRRVLNPSRLRKRGKTAETDPMRVASRPSLTRTIFSSLAILTLISFMSHYLISATETLYGRGVAVLLVLIPIGVVFFVRVPFVRYAMLCFFLGADLLSIKALRDTDMAKITESTLTENPEYKRLQKDYASAELERSKINPVTHPSLLALKAKEVKAISDRMAVLEQTSVVTERAAADRTRTEVTLGVRALLLIAAAVFAHALLHYSSALDYDRFMRKAFGRDVPTKRR